MSNVSVFRDQPTGDLRPALQMGRNGTGFYITDNTIETVPLENGDPNIDPMGDVSQVTVTLIGERNADNDDPEIAVCRDARDDPRTYTSGVTPVPTTIFQDDGTTDTELDQWEHTFTSGDFASTTNENSVGVKITIPQTSATNPPTKVLYMKVNAVTATDTGLTSGTIETYDNPATFRQDIDDSDWVNSDFLTLNRLEAVERLRTLTESDRATNPSPHWDAYLDADLTGHWEERRGNDVTNHTYSVADENLADVEHEFFGGELAYQTVALGAGSGVAQSRLVSKAEYTSDLRGLYDSDRDPANGAKYGESARVMQFVDPNEVSSSALLRKARAFHKLHRDPIETLDVTLGPEHIRFFATGDSIDVDNVKTRTDGLFRVVALRRSWGARGEKVSVKLGHDPDDVFQALTNTARNQDIVVGRPQQKDLGLGLTGDIVHFDKDHFAPYTFGIGDGEDIERVTLRVTSVPFQSTARTVEAAGGVLDSNTSVADEGLPGGYTSVTTPNNTTDWSAFATLGNPIGSGIAGTLNYTFLIAHILNQSGSTNLNVDLEFRLRNTSDDSTLVTYGPFNGAVIKDPLDSGDTVGYLFRSQSKEGAGSEVLGGKTYELQGRLRAGNASTENVELFVSGSLSLVYRDVLKFGIYQFDGDGGDGTEEPIYAQGIEMSVDPADADNDGVPDNAEFLATAHQVRFGDEFTPQTVEIDVTNFLDTAGGTSVIRNGEHRIWFRSGQSPNNEDAIGAVQVTPFVRRIEAGR